MVLGTVDRFEILESRLFGDVRVYDRNPNGDPILLGVFKSEGSAMDWLRTMRHQKRLRMTRLQ